MKSNWKNKMRVTALLMSCTLALTACGSAAEEAQEEETEVVVNTITADTGALALNNSFVGTISPEDTVYVMPLIAGVVTETFFEEGDKVEAGDLLFKIDDENAQLQNEQAKLAKENAYLQAEITMTTTQDSTNLQMQSSINQAQLGYESAQIAYVSAKDGLKQAENAVDDMKDTVKSLQAQYDALVASGNDVSANELKASLTKAESGLSTAKSARDSAQKGFYSAQSAYKSAEESKEIVQQTAELTQGEVLENTERGLDIALAQADVSMAMSNLALTYYNVTAPVSGTIQSKGVSVNGMAAQGSPAYTIVNDNSMTVTFNVSEDIKNTFWIGQKITVERNGNEYEATITEIGSSVNAQTGLFQIKASVEVNGAELPSGVSVKITADTYKASDVILIPYDSVYYDNEGAYVYLNVDNRAKKTFVQTGIFNEDTIVITDGIQKGDVVVTSWSPQLTNGALLRSANLQIEEKASDENEAPEEE